MLTKKILKEVEVTEIPTSNKRKHSTYQCKYKNTKNIPVRVSAVN